MRLRLALILSLALGLPSFVLPQGADLGLGMRSAQRSLEAGNLDKARELIGRLLERDKKSVAIWDLRVLWATAAEDRGDEIYSRHQALRLSVRQKAAKSELKRRREELLVLDPFARDLFSMKADFTKRLRKIAQRYEKQGRPHSGIQVWKQVLALDPESLEAQEAIERIAASPDPSLAGDAKPKDLFEDVTEEWIKQHDAEHMEWKTRSKLERPNYWTHTDAGYVVMVRAGEAMEQMNAFYRQFFRYGTEEHGGSVPRIELRIFKNRDEYLEKGSGPPVEWSGGQFTGAAVETYIPASGGFEGMTGVLFHEAAHQFVSLATTAVGWLNEGLASFFEGTQILANGTVLMNMPANHRLVPLAGRMEEGWMASYDDGLSPDDASQTPDTAPTFRIVLENKYPWGPPWYAPTWGVVFFLYNYQDPVDGRFVYRRAFQEFINKSGGRSGDGAVKNFEEVVLANPMPPLKITRPEDAPDVRLPATVEELDDVWKEYILRLRDEAQGNLETHYPYKLWGQYAAKNKLFEEAAEHFEKGLVATPEDVELLGAFADLLAGEMGNPDRATKLVLQSLHVLEKQDPMDPKAIRTAERRLAKLDPKQTALADVRDALGASTRALIARYEAAGIDTMVMDLAWRMGSNLDLPDLFDSYEAAVRRGGKSLAIWDLAYNEYNLDGWDTQGTDASFKANGSFLQASFGEFSPDVYDYQFLTLDRVTSGDFSMEAKMQLTRGEIAFAGFVFGQKGPSTFHGLLYMPGKVVAKEGTANSDTVDLMSSFGSGTPKIWRHVPVNAPPPSTDTVSEIWRTLRMDISGAVVDFYVDGELLATHEFPSREVLRGRFGLITGRGNCKFRDVRYLARQPGDQASQIEREIRMEEMRAAGGGAVGGSYAGVVPPFPQVQEWVQGSRVSWDEYGAVPQLLVFMSIPQNDIVPVDGWLTALYEELSSIDLAITIICSPNDADRIAEYMQTHPLPGDVGIDARPETGIGLSFERYFIDRFNLPRVLLLGLDQKVLWEGDPGVILGSGLTLKYESYVDTPLEELMARAKLKEAALWIADWEERGAPMLHDGDFEATLSILEAAREFEEGLFPEVDRALSQQRAVEAALHALESSSESIHASDADPALAVLLEWGEVLELTPNAKRTRALKGTLESPAGKAWALVMKATARYEKRHKIPFEERRAGLFEDLRRHSGLLVREFLADLEEVKEDEGAFGQLVGDSDARPRLWLARAYFGW